MRKPLSTQVEKRTEKKPTGTVSIKRGAVLSTLSILVLAVLGLAILAPSINLVNLSAANATNLQTQGEAALELPILQENAALNIGVPSGELKSQELQKYQNNVVTFFPGLTVDQSLNTLDQWRIGATASYLSSSGIGALNSDDTENGTRFEDYVRKMKYVASGNSEENVLTENAVVALRDLINGIFGSAINAMDVDFGPIECGGICIPPQYLVSDNAPIVGKAITALRVIGDDFVYRNFNLADHTVDITPKQMAVYLEGLYGQAIQKEALWLEARANEEKRLEAQALQQSAQQNAQTEGQSTKPDTGTELGMGQAVPTSDVQQANGVGDNSSEQPAPSTDINVEQYYNQNWQQNEQQVSMIQTETQKQEMPPVAIASMEGMGLGFSVAPIIWSATEVWAWLQGEKIPTEKTIYVREVKEWVWSLEIGNQTIGPVNVTELILTTSPDTDYSGAKKAGAAGYGVDGNGEWFKLVLILSTTSFSPGQELSGQDFVQIVYETLNKP